MPCSASRVAILIAVMSLLMANVASADDAGGEAIPALPSAQASVPYSDAPAEVDEDGWRYDTYYILPLTRHMKESGLPLVGQILLYPLAAAIDIGQLPVGVLAGLAGE